MRSEVLQNDFGLENRRAVSQGEGASGRQITLTIKHYCPPKVGLTSESWRYV